MKPTTCLWLCLLPILSAAQPMLRTNTPVTIGNTTWMAQNLNTPVFRNGDLIPEARTDEEWIQAGENQQPAWCYYANDADSGDVYGRLYNGYAVMDPRGLAPEGWRICTWKDWENFRVQYGKYAGKKLKSTLHWINRSNSDNLSGFGALPGGYRHSDGLFVRRGEIGDWWTSVSLDEVQTKAAQLETHNALIMEESMYKTYGLSVRCVKE